VSEQLHGVSQVMDDLVREICREAQDRYAQEEQIMKGLEELGVYIQRMEIISLTAGNIKIELIHTYPPGFADFENLIVPLLTDILKEKMSIEREQAALPEEGMTTTRFASAKEIEVETGVAYAAKMGEYVSGDSFAAVELDNGKFAVALSDGMGNGERAKAESSAALSILQQLLQSGMEEKAAIKSVNSILMLRSPDEVYATVDLVMIDLLSAQSTFMKIGATPSFIKRGRQVFPISANNLPIGILHEIEIEMIKMQLQPEDILVMMSDGVFDAPGYEADKELWIESVLADMLADTPQDIADALLHRVIRQYGGEIADDMTVIAVKISKVQKDWASLSWHEQHRAEWPQFIH
jgi:stage II sporulation protein E